MRMMRRVFEAVKETVALACLVVLALARSVMCRNTNRLWWTRPFRRGAVYEVLADFPAPFDAFSKGERLTFEYAACSHYDGYRGYFFLDESNEWRRIDVDWGEPPSAGMEHLQRIG